MDNIINAINISNRRYKQLSTTNKQMEELNNKIGDIAIKGNRLMFFVDSSDGYVTSTVKDILLTDNIYTVYTRNSIYRYEKVIGE